MGHSCRQNRSAIPDDLKHAGVVALPAGLPYTPPSPSIAMVSTPRFVFISYAREDGTDFAAIADGCIAVTPLHFDLTDEAGIESLSGFDLEGLLRPAAREVE